MPIVNRATREVSCKIVYWGPAGAGKTRNLQHVFDEVPPDRRGTTAALSTTAERPLFFDYLPLELGEIAGLTAKLHLYAVPGGSFYAATRRHVMRDVDGVVFVAESRMGNLDVNVESLQELHENIADEGVDPRSMPMVMQYNKRDLPEDELLPIDELDSVLNFRGVPAFPAAAAEGRGVFETLRAISDQALRRVGRGV